MELLQKTTGPYFGIDIDRAKQRGTRKKVNFFVTGEQEVEWFMFYIDCLKKGKNSLVQKQQEIEKKHGNRLYRKLNTDFVPGLPIGKNTLANCGKILGKAIGKPDYQKLTGHWQRRTGITLGAEHGNIHNIYYICFETYSITISIFI